MDIVINLLMWLASILGFAGVIGILPFSIVGIVYLAKSGNETDTAKQSSQRKKGIVYLVLPWAMAICGLVILVVIFITRHMFIPATRIRY